MLAKAILVHGVIGYKFCWLLPSEDHNQGAPAGHESNGAIATAAARDESPLMLENLELMLNVCCPKKFWLFEDNRVKLSKMSCENFVGCFAAAKLIHSQLVSQLIHVLSMVPDSGTIWFVSSWCPLIVVLRRE